MTDEVKQHLRRSQKLLAVVKSRAEIELPEVVAHTAYYSMHHAAVAVLIAHGIAIPKTHSGLIARLGQLDRDEAWRAKADVCSLGAGFGSPFDRRLRSHGHADDGARSVCARRCDCLRCLL
ncbi:MAG TPA: HEPN domain-containing protein [Reyranella sp.]